MLDVFNNGLFSVVSLTDAINKPVFQPQRIGQMGLFSEKGVRTTTIIVEEKDGQLVLVSPSPRGSPGQTIDKNKAKGRPSQFRISKSTMRFMRTRSRAFARGVLKPNCRRFRAL